ncbi:MAG: hypothetical protein ACOH2N_20650 [Devosia sp.]
MRVPSIGLPLDERRIVREGYRIAERMMANYQDPPGLLTKMGNWLAECRQLARGFYQTLVGN